MYQDKRKENRLCDVLYLKVLLVTFSLERKSNQKVMRGSVVVFKGAYEIDSPGRLSLIFCFEHCRRMYQDKRKKRERGEGDPSHHCEWLNHK